MVKIFKYMSLVHFGVSVGVKLRGLQVCKLGEALR